MQTKDRKQKSQWTPNAGLDRKSSQNEQRSTNLPKMEQNRLKQSKGRRSAQIQRMRPVEQQTGQKRWLKQSKC